MEGLGPRDPKIAHHYGAPTAGHRCDACGRETATYDAGRRERQEPSGVWIIVPRRICPNCVRAIAEDPTNLGESFDATFHPGEAPTMESIPEPDPDARDEDCKGK